MLRTNLSTRPFYNVRAVQVILGIAMAIVLAVTVFNAGRLIRLTASERTLGGQADSAEAEATRLRRDAGLVRAQIDPKELDIVSAAAQEANAIIDRRVFSWTGLLAQFEQTLPPDVRITAIQPRLEQDGSFAVSLTVDARTVEDLEVFLEALEKNGRFRNVLATDEQTAADGLIEAVISSVYEPEVDESGGAAPAAAAPVTTTVPAVAGLRPTRVVKVDR